MAQTGRSNRLSRAVNSAYDHILGPADAPITLVEYGSYDCPYCRAANERIAELRDEFGDRMRYVFRHRPITGSDTAQRAAELAERAHDQKEFWAAHVKLMSRSENLTVDDLVTVAKDLDLTKWDDPAEEASLRRAEAKVDADTSSAHASGVMFTPTFFINGRRYDGPWDSATFSEALRGTLGYRFRAAALDFVRWGPSAGFLLLGATILALILTNSMWGPAFTAFWETYFGFTFNGSGFRMSLLHWINDGLLTIFFLVVGLEIKREFTVGHLADRHAAALPAAAAIGGMLVPALIYMLIIPQGPWAHGWGVPMATDTAFAVALIVMMGSRVPIELRIFLTAAAIVDDIGAILVVAFFYTGELHFGYLIAAAAMTGVLATFNRFGVYRVSLYMALGIALWALIHAGGLHATLAGVVLALVIPTRPPPNLNALKAQVDAVLLADMRQGDEVLRHGISLPTMRAIDAIYDRLESPAERLLRHAAARSSYLVLPLFAFANAGVVITMDVVSGHEQLMFAIIAALVVGKPLGMLAASALAVWLGVAVKPDAYSWRQVAGAGALAGIGFTMSLFIAGQAFPVPSDFAAAKIAVFCASILAAVIGVAVLWYAAKQEEKQEEEEDTAPSESRPADVTAL